MHSYLYRINLLIKLHDSGFTKMSQWLIKLKDKKGYRNLGKCHANIKWFLLWYISKVLLKTQNYWAHKANWKSYTDFPILKWNTKNKWWFGTISFAKGN